VIGGLLVFSVPAPRLCSSKFPRCNRTSRERRHCMLMKFKPGSKCTIPFLLDSPAKGRRVFTPRSCASSPD
jgi:hypothetical protein